LSERSHKKYQHETLTILLDDCFCNDEVAGILTKAGFVLELFTTHFARNAGRPGAREQGVKDPRVIALSNKLKTVVFTTDRRMAHDHKAEIKKHASAMIVATAHKMGTDDMWANAFVVAKQEIERMHKKKPRPWCARINQQGQITKCESYDPV
jgi:hypothetical protein